ncbi:MAG: hypothetical protein IPI67_07805 [Myxococcales bacterium]|jgi:hypothetical protein|nr:hypothetical protein [Myxococcales bacterium]MCC6898729.1 hypothetical protein [Polyangiaceae bacterium]
MRRGRRSLRRSLWPLLAALLLVLVSGLPVYAAELLGVAGDSCECDCGGSDERGSCPPNCPYGACAKVPQAVPPGPEAAVAPPPESAFAVLAAPEALVLCDYASEVFHPPRA